MDIVQARIDDVDTWVRMSSTLFREDAGTRDSLTDVGWPEKHGRDHFAGLVSSDDAVCLLARSGPTPVGYLAGLILAPTTLRPVKIAELQSMYVVEDHRRRGVGQGLVERFRAWATDLGARRMSVTAYAANRDAVRFYQRQGFRPRSVTLEQGL